jgi:tetratricopeptide (TPR) repeat protein
VAWIAERKNVLSTFFFILTIWAYWRYVEAARPAKFYVYALALILFALGLAAKSMLVTLPFLLLLLDGWPLRRISLADGVGKWIQQRQTWLLVWEKIPFFLLAIADCAITFLAQKQGGGVRTLAVEPLAYRLMNTPVAYVEYLVKTFWPEKLCVLYPFPETLQTTAAIMSLVLLTAVTFLAWRWKNKFPWMLFGWLWFLGALVPVIGLVQVGAQAMADRYAYQPAIGLFLIAAGGLNAGWLVWPRLRVLMVTGVAAFLFFCLTLTGRQIFYWQDSVTLFNHVVTLYPEYALAHDLLGTAYAANGQTTEAIVHYAQSVRLHPDVASAQFNLGRALIQSGRFAEAQGAMADALVQLPDNALLHNTRGVALMLDGQPDAAQKEFSRAIELQPDFANAYFNLGKVLLAAGQSQKAIAHFHTELKWQPDLADRIAAELKAYQTTSIQPSLVPGKN